MANIKFRYRTCQDVSVPEDESKSRQIYCGYAPASSFVELEDNENVRTYYLDSTVSQSRRKGSQVHQKIRETLNDRPEDFHLLNSGITIIAHDVEQNLDEDLLRIYGASIINGSQTQGEIQEYLKECVDGEIGPDVFFQLIVLNKENGRDDLVADISVARNFQNKVKDISIAGRKGILDEFQDNLRETYPEVEIRKSETDMGVVNTQLLLQIVLAIMPYDLFHNPTQNGRHFKNRVFTYGGTSKCLKIYTGYHEGRMGAFKDQYQFFLDHGATAYAMYQKWQSHSAFVGTDLDEARNREGKVPNGILFPIFAAHSNFFQEKSSTKWELKMPRNFDELKFVHNNVQEVYVNLADSNPQTMGKSPRCYEILEDMTRSLADSA